MRDSMTRAPFCLFLLAFWAHFIPSEAFDTASSYTASITSTSSSSLTSSSSIVQTGPYPAGNTTTFAQSGTGVSSLGSTTTSKSSTSSSVSTSSLTTSSGSFEKHIDYHAANSVHGALTSWTGTGAAGQNSTARGVGSASGRGASTGFPQATGTGGIFFQGGSLTSSGTVNGVHAGTGLSRGTGFPQLIDFGKGRKISGSSFGSMNGISGGYGPTGSGASGSLGGWARNPACTASWNSRVKAANGTVMTTVTYSYTMTLTDKAVSSFRQGEVATGPTTAVFNAGTVTYEVGSNDQCCGDCNIRYPNVRVYYWPTNNTNTWCLEGQSTMASAGIPTLRGNQILDPGLPNLPKLTDLPSLTSTGPVGQTTGALADYSGIPPGGFWGGQAKVKPRNDGHPMITAAPEVSKGRPAHQIKAREYLPLGGLKGLPKLNNTNLLFGEPHLNLTLGNSNSSNVGLHKEVIDVVDGVTFVSPTVYVVISTISASDKCGPVGDIHTSLTIPYNQGQLSTVDALGVTSAFNFADLPCPPTSWAFPNPLQGNTAALQNLASDYHPTILVPHASVQHLDRAWQSCNIIDVGNGYDPPRQLTPQTTMVSDTGPSTMCSDGSVADASDPVYIENTASHCLESASLPIVQFPIKQPVYHTKDPALIANPGPVIKTPEKEPLVQVTAHQLMVPVPQAQTQAPAVASQQPAPIQPASNPPVQSPPAQTPPAQNPPVQTPPPQNPPTQNPPAQNPPAQNPPAQNPPAQNPPAQNVKQVVAPPPPQSVVVGGQTIAQGAPSVNVGGQSVALSGANIIVGSSTGPAPTTNPAPTNPAAPIVAGGIKLTPASTNVPAQPPPVQVGGLTFSAPAVKAKAPSNPQAEPLPAPVVAGGITYQPIAQQPSQTPVTVGSLTFNPVPSSPANNVKQNEVPAIGAPGQTGAANIVVGGQTYVAGVTAMPADKPVVQNGVTVAPVPAGAPASTPLGVVGGQPIVGGSSQAVVAGQTISAGGPPATVHGTPVSLGTSNIIIGSSTAALPPPAPSNEPSALGVVGGQVINGNSKSAVVGGQTISAGGAPVTIQGTPVSLGSSNIVIGSSTAALPTASPGNGGSTNAPLGVVAGQVITGDKSHAVVDGQTILPGSAATISGTPVSLGSSNIVIGTNSIPLPTQAPGEISSAGPSALQIGGTTVSNGGPPVTVSGTRVSLGPSGLVVGSSTVPLTNPAELSQATGGPPVYSFDGVGITQGSPAVTVSGTRVSLGSSNVIVGSNTIALPSSSIFSVGGQAFTPEAGGFSIDGTTLTPGGPGVTVSGTPISIDSSSDLILGSSTFALPAGATGSPTLNVAGDTLTALPKSLGGGYVVDGQTITPGGAPKTISGTAISLNTKSSLIIGSSTVALASAGPDDFYKGADAPLTADGETFTPLGTSGVIIDGTTLSVSGAAITDHGTIISLASNGLVVGSSTFAYATPVPNTLTPVSNGPVSGQGPTPSVFAIDGETFTAEPSGLAIGGTDISIGGSPVTLNGTVISLASDSIVVGASTIPLASVTGLTSAIDAASATAGATPSLIGPAGAGPTSTGKGAKTGAAGRLEVADLGDWKVLLGMGVLTVLIAWLLFV